MASRQRTSSTAKIVLIILPILFLVLVVGALTYGSSLDDAGSAVEEPGVNTAEEQQARIVPELLTEDGTDLLAADDLRPYVDQSVSGESLLVRAVVSPTLLLVGRTDEQSVLLSLPRVQDTVLEDGRSEGALLDDGARVDVGTRLTVQGIVRSFQANTLPEGGPVGADVQEMVERQGAYIEGLTVQRA